MNAKNRGIFYAWQVCIESYGESKHKQSEKAVLLLHSIYAVKHVSQFILHFSTFLRYVSAILFTPRNQSRWPIFLSETRCLNISDFPIFLYKPRAWSASETFFKWRVYNDLKSQLFMRFLWVFVMCHTCFVNSLAEVKLSSLCIPMSIYCTSQLAIKISFCVYKSTYTDNCNWYDWSALFLLFEGEDLMIKLWA